MSRVQQRGLLSMLLAALGVLGLVVLTLPIAALFLGVSWQSVLHAVGSQDVGAAVALSLVTTIVATLICLLLGVPLSWWMAGMRSRAVRWVRAIVLLPLVLPPVAGGVALLLLLGRKGPVGQVLADVGITLPFSTAAVVMSQVFVAMPFMVLAAEAAFRSVDVQQHDVARSLGASQWRRFWTVAMPLAAPGIAAGALLSWARAFGEFGATVTFAGSLPGVTETLPLAIYRALESDQESAVALAIVMLVISIAVVIVLGARWLPWGGFGSDAGSGAARAVEGDPLESWVDVSDHDARVPGVQGVGSYPDASPSPNMEGLVARVVVPRPDFDVDLALTVPPGEVLVVSGPNGAGKSTALLAIAGLVPVSSADVAVGEDVWSNDAGQLPAEDRSVGWVPQNGHLFGHLSVRDNVAFGVRSRGASRAVARDIAESVLAEHGMVHLGDRRAATLSGGQARRVALMRAVAPNPRVLLLDEPTSGLDLRARAQMLAWLSESLATCRKPTILVTHDKEVAEALGVAVVQMDLGRIIAASDPQFQSGTAEWTARNGRVNHGRR